MSSVAELMQLRDDKDRLYEYVNKLNVIEKITKEKEELNQTIEDLASK